MARRLRPGDVLQIEMPHGLGFLLYIGKHPKYGDAIVVCPAVLPEQPADAETLFGQGYFTFYPAGAAVAQGLATVVDRISAPPMPQVFRRAGARSGNTVETWIIQDQSGSTVKSKLSPDERRLPIAAIWNHEFLVQRILQGWRPELAGEVSSNRDDTLVGANASLPGRGQVVHYLYLPTEANAFSVARDLQQRGFLTTTRLGAEGTDWLVLARHEPSDEEALDAAQRMMEAIVAPYRGEYDGCETEA